MHLLDCLRRKYFSSNFGFPSEQAVRYTLYLVAKHLTFFKRFPKWGKHILCIHNIMLFPEICVAYFVILKIFVLYHKHGGLGVFKSGTWEWAGIRWFDCACVVYIVILNSLGLSYEGLCKIVHVLTSYVFDYLKNTLLPKWWARNMLKEWGMISGQPQQYFMQKLFLQGLIPVWYWSGSARGCTKAVESVAESVLNKWSGYNNRPFRAPYSCTLRMAKWRVQQEHTLGFESS